MAAEMSAVRATIEESKRMAKEQEGAAEKAQLHFFRAGAGYTTSLTLMPTLTLEQKLEPQP